MTAETVPLHNVSAVVPLLMVTSMERSLAFYVDGLGFTVQNRWIPDGHLRWCWLSLGGAALMLQEATGSSIQKLAAAGVPGNGVGLNFQCIDALTIFREAATRGIQALREPQVGNFAWEVFFADPDGYKINFSSPTDVPEETLLSELGTSQTKRTDPPRNPTPTPIGN
jgi:catechol 2,3-dioxygenase-like lactoylglutathione lyase family enzyme